MGLETIVTEAGVVSKLHIDFETKSVTDLRKFGLDIYARHPSTDIWVMAYCFDNGQIKYWLPGMPLPQEIVDHINNGGLVVAHNVMFEHAIWNNVMVRKYGAPVLKLTQCDCTMARAYAMSLPGALKMLAEALGVSSRKDMDGHALMMSMAKPRSYDAYGDPIWWDDPKRLQRLISYCVQDVAVERACDDLMVPLSPAERKVWLLDQRINARGIGVDRKAIEKAKPIIDRVKKKLNADIKRQTNGQVEETSEASAILAWCNRNGIPMESLRKHDLEEWLSIESLPDNVREVLEIRGDAAKASVAKLDAMLNMSLFDGRARGQFQYHGASTGRWAGRGIQLHNLPRPDKRWKDPQLQATIINGIAEGKYDEHFIEDAFGPFMHVMGSMVRGMLRAAGGHEFIGADLANIEGRMLAWCAGETWKLQAFTLADAGLGPDIYFMTAGRILGKPATKEAISDDERQAYGKVPELALGYGGGVGAFKSMAVNYGVDLTDEQADEIKVAWREVHPATKQYWYDVQRAAMAAIRNQGGEFSAGPAGRAVKFKVAGSFLWLLLPSSRVLCYPYPQIDMVKAPWGDMIESVTYMGIDGNPKSKFKGKWCRLKTYGGSLVENIVQALARDVLVEGMFRMEEKDYPIVLHVHDEADAEVKIGFGDVKEVEQLMSVVPVWAQGLPLSAKGFRGERYRKS